MQSFDYNMLPQWIKNSDFITSQDKTDQIFLLGELMIPDILTNEMFSIIFRSVRYFSGYPSNFWDYIKKINTKEINNFKETVSESELEFVNLLLEFITIHKKKFRNMLTKKIINGIKSHL